MRKDETLKMEVVDRGTRAPNHPHYLRQPRGDDLGRWHLLSRLRQIVQHSVWTIEIPLAGSVQRLEDVLHPIDRGPLRGLDQRKQARSVECDRAMLRVHALDRKAVVQPPRDPHNFHVPQVAPSRRYVAL